MQRCLIQDGDGLLGDRWRLELAPGVGGDLVLVLQPLVEDPQAPVPVRRRAGLVAREQSTEERFDILDARVGQAVTLCRSEVRGGLAEGHQEGMDGVLHCPPRSAVVKPQVNRRIARAASSIGRAADS